MNIIEEAIREQSKLSREDVEVVLRVGNSCNALCKEFGWATRHTAAEWLLISRVIDQARLPLVKSDQSAEVTTSEQGLSANP